ncbi:MAG: FAD-binding oxidoreductase [Alphaproteobacteria bacterium]|nr:FAD-binding oxidoreductase [Alphaproteobacteria bacterium]
MIDEIHLKKFISILDQKGILTQDTDMEPYEKGWRGDHGKAALVLRPANTGEVSKIVSYCVQNNLALVPQSGNTGLMQGSTPDQSGIQILLSFERMNKIFEIDPVNGSAHIGAGCRLSKLNETCEEFDLHFPIDIGSDPCLGGMTSTNSGGSRFLKYGGVRENTLGLKVVLGDENGTILDLLMPLHKNNVGPDLKHMFIGTCGIFGLITEVIVKLAPNLKQQATALLVPKDLASVNILLREIEKRLGTYLSAFEGMSGEALKRGIEHNPNISNPFAPEGIPDYALLIEISRTWDKRDAEQSLDEILETTLEELWEFPNTPLANAVIAAPEKLWDIRHGLSEGTQKSGKLIGFDISFKRGDLIAFKNHMTAYLKENYPHIAICDFGHIGDGGMHFSLVIPFDHKHAKDTDFQTNLRKNVFDIVVKKFGGSFSAEHSLGRINMKAYQDYTRKEVKEINRKIKSLLSPASISAIEFE